MGKASQTLSPWERWQAQPDGEGAGEIGRGSGRALTRAFLLRPLHRFAVPLSQRERI